MIQFFEKDITDGNGSPLKVIFEYNSRYNLSNPKKAFNEKIIPEMEKKKDWYFGEKLLNCLYHINLVYNFQEICYLAIDDPTCDLYGNKSFPGFINYHLSEWAGKRINYYKYPPTKPFRFVCRAYDSGPYIYYLEATAEAALLRDFNKYPPLETELVLWQKLRKTKSPIKATITDKVKFLIEYARVINTNTIIKINNYNFLHL